MIALDKYGNKGPNWLRWVMFVLLTTVFLGLLIYPLFK